MLKSYTSWISEGAVASTGVVYTAETINASATTTTILVVCLREHMVFHVLIVAVMI